LSITYKWLLSNKRAVTKTACAVNQNCIWSPIKLTRDEEIEKVHWLSERAYVVEGMHYYTFTVTYMASQAGEGETFNYLFLYFVGHAS